MDYETLLLDLEFKEAQELISKRVSGIYAYERTGDVEYRNSTNYHLAVLSQTTLPNGKNGSQLQYRTTMISPVAAHARRKAQEIRNAVVSHRYE